MTDTPEILKYRDISIGTWFRAPAFKGLFLKVTPRTSYSFQWRETHKIAPEELVQVVSIKIEEKKRRSDGAQN